MVNRGRQATLRLEKPAKKPIQLRRAGRKIRQKGGSRFCGDAKSTQKRHGRSLLTVIMKPRLARETAERAALAFRESDSKIPGRRLLVGKIGSHQDTLRNKANELAERMGFEPMIRL
jgi:hypothetical protein